MNQVTIPTKARALLTEAHEETLKMKCANYNRSPKVGAEVKASARARRDARIAEALQLTATARLKAAGLTGADEDIREHLTTLEIVTASDDQIDQMVKAANALTASFGAYDDEVVIDALQVSHQACEAAQQPKRGSDKEVRYS